MMWGYYDGGAWLLMAATMLVFWGGIAGLIVLALRTSGTSRDDGRAMDVLRRRLAGGVRAHPQGAARLIP
ncbi:MAG TPA: hypothetical protein VIC57_17365 [Candidatus Dormibacteraeota bacterium]|jgi:hypothetical protein